MADTGVEKLSKNELKRRLKAEQKAKEKIEKDQSKAAQESDKAASKKTSEPERIKEEDISPNEFFRLRSLAVAKLKESGNNPYPHKFAVTTSLEEFIEAYNNINEGEILENTKLSVAVYRKMTLLTGWFCKNFLTVFPYPAKCIEQAGAGWQQSSR